MRNVLLISEDSDVVELFSRVAERSGVEMLAPDTTEEAAVVIQEDPLGVDMILVDLVPRAQRMTFLEQIREWSNSVPLIALTQVEDEMVGPIACAKGATETFQKPLSERAVEKILTRL